MKCKICSKEIKGRNYTIKGMMNHFDYYNSENNFIDLKEQEYIICEDCYKDLLSKQQSSVKVSTRRGCSNGM